MGAARSVLLQPSRSRTVVRNREKTKDVSFCERQSVRAWLGITEIVGGQEKESVSEPAFGSIDINS
jgi:hypothetical protein